MTQYAKPSPASPSVAPGSHDASHDDGAAKARNDAQTGAILRSAPKPQATAAPASAVAAVPKGSFAIAQASQAQRGVLLAQALNKGSFDGTVKALIDSALTYDPSFKQSFIAAWKQIKGSPAIADESAQPWKVFGDIVKAKFSNKDQQEYLLTTASYGEPGVYWEIRLALGSVFKSWAGAQSEVVRLVEKAAEKGKYPIHRTGQDYGEQPIANWNELWTELNKDSNFSGDFLGHLTKDQYARLQAAHATKLSEHAAETDVEAQKLEAEAKQKQEQAALIGGVTFHASGKKDAIGHRLKHEFDAAKGTAKKEATAATDHATAARSDANTALAQTNSALHGANSRHAKGDHAARTGQTSVMLAKITHLAMIVRDQQKLFKALSPEAIDIVKEWLEANHDPTMRAMAIQHDSPFVVALDDVLKKPRDREFYTSMVHGGGKPATELLAKTQSKKEQHEIHESSDALDMFEALFKREKEKTDAGKGKKRQKLLALLRETAPGDRNLYLAYVAKKSVKDLETEQGHQDALTAFATELKKIIPDEATRAEIIALFEFPNANSGTHYIALKRLVAEDKFDKKKALSHLTKLTGDEFHQVRADQDLVTKLETGLGSDKGAVKALLGSTTAVVAAPGEDASARAKDDAELNPAHWAVIIKRELDKPELLLRQHGGQSLEKAALYFYQAQTAAERNQEIAHVPVKVFMKEVIDLLGSSTITLEVQMPFLIPSLERGERLSAADLRAMMVGTFQNYQEGYAKIFETANGKELLDDYSNFQEFLDKKSAIEQKNGPEKQAELEALHGSFVLGVKKERRQEIDKVCGPAKGAKMANRLIARLREAAETDPRFVEGLEGKAGAKTGYVNNDWARDKMTLQGEMELDDRAQSGMLKFGKFSSWGRTHQQANSRVVRDVRNVSNDAEDAHEQDPSKSLAEHQDAALAKHKGTLEDDRAADASAREKFAAVKQRAKLIAEIAVTVIAAVVVAAATHGAGAAPMVALLIKLGGALVTGAAKMAMSKMVSGKDFDSRAEWTKFIASNVAFAAGDFGWGVPEGLEHIQITSEYVKAMCDGLIMGPGKTMARDAMVALASRGDEDVGAADVFLSAAVATVEEQVINAISAHLKLDQDSRHEAADSGAKDSGGADSGSADSGHVDSGHADSGSADSGSADSGHVESGGEAEKAPDLWAAKKPWDSDLAHDDEATKGLGKLGGLAADHGIDAARDAAKDKAQERAAVEKKKTPGAKGKSNAKGWQGAPQVISVEIKDPSSEAGKLAQARLFADGGVLDSSTYGVTATNAHYCPLPERHLKRMPEGLVLVQCHFVVFENEMQAFLKAAGGDGVKIKLVRDAGKDEFPVKNS